MKKGRISTQSFFIISILLLSTSLTYGKTITVGIGLGYDYESIQPAIDAADEGDTIIVAQGEYFEAINFNGKNIVLTSSDPNDWNIVTNTIIYLNGGPTPPSTFPVVTFSGQESESCILQGIEITGGYTTYGGGINGNGTKATIRNCYIYNNHADYCGGGIYNCDGLIDNCTISRNITVNNTITSKGGGLYGCDGIIKNCTFEHNGAGNSTYKGEGGGLHSCNGQIIDCTIQNNGMNNGDGGGLCCCNAIIMNCIIQNNGVGHKTATVTIPGNGGGFCNCSNQIINCIIQNNTATNKGGGLYNCNGILSGCTIKNNTTTSDSGGGLANCMGSVVDCDIIGNTSPLWHAGGAIDCNLFKNCIISGNSARGYGGGLYNCKKVSNCKISGNSSEIYPGAGLSDCNSVTNCIISGNTAGGSGAGLYDCNEVVNCTIVGNYSQQKASAIYFKGNYGIIDNTIIWDNMAAEGGQVLVECIEPNTALYNLSIDYSDIQNGPNSVIVGTGAVLRWEPNNLDTYPLFKQPGSWNNTTHKWNEGDYHLLANSVCIDAGDPNRNYADQNDIDGDPRLIGQYVDIGADEAPIYVPPQFVQLELSGPAQVNEGETAQYNAIGRYNDNTQTNLNHQVTWSVEPSGIGTIDANGLFSLGQLDESVQVTIKASYTPAVQQTLYIAQMTVLCVNIPEQVMTYYVDTASGNDQNNGLSRQTAFKTISAGIDAANDGDTVLVYPGVYRESVVFWGKNISLKSAEDAAVIENPDNIAVLFCFGETPQCKIQNFVIRNSKIGILNVLNSSPTIKNLTIVGNDNGIECFDSDPDISNCIFWYNNERDFVNCTPEYSCTENTGLILHVIDNNIHLNPLFVDPNENDYHLKSERGRYWPRHDIWTLDNETSPCIDTGNPDDDFTKERQPNGGRINMGAYGNTPYASLSLSSGEQYRATQPNPSNGAIDVSVRPQLSWTAGASAIQHDVYLGTNLDDTRDATRDNPLGILVSKGQISTSFTPASNLNSNRMYFWRVDEIDSSGTITKGEVWTFITRISTKTRACFPADTPVWADGRMVEISKVIAGQKIGKADCAMSISGSIKGLEEHGAGIIPCYEMTLESGNSITIVHSHYFKTISGEWKKIEELSAGMQLQTMNGPIAIKSVIKKEKPFLGASYNLMLDGSEQYFVGKDGVAALDCSKKTWEILEAARK